LLRAQLRTLLYIFWSVSRQQFFQVWRVGRAWFAARSQLVDRICHASKAKMLLKIDDRSDFIPLPATGYPPAWVTIQEHSSIVRQIVPNQWHQIVAGPPAARANCLPVAGADGFPVNDGDCLRAGNHDSISRNISQLAAILLAHRSPLAKLLAGTSAQYREDHCDYQHYGHASGESDADAAEAARQNSDQKVCTQGRNRGQTRQEISPVNRRSVVEIQQQITQQAHRGEQKQMRKLSLVPLVP